MDLENLQVKSDSQFISQNKRVFFPKIQNRNGIKVMQKLFTICFLLLVCFYSQSSGQIIYKNVNSSVKVSKSKPVPKKVLIQIVRAEDELRFDKTLESLMRSQNLKVRTRAILAAGRIGDERAVPLLAEMVKRLEDPGIVAMSAFALGEIESIKGADSILKALGDEKTFPKGKARAIEAAGKIAGSNAKEAKSKELGEAILDALEKEARKNSSAQNKELILLGITAALRAKPDEADYVVAKFLTNLDSRIRADAANILARLRAKNANKKLRAMLLTDSYPIARANAARALAAGEDKGAVNMLVEAAKTDEDLRVRINAIRALSGLKDKKSAEHLLERGEKLLADYKKSEYKNPFEKNELLDLATALGRILEKTKNERAIKLLDELISLDNLQNAAFSIARIRVSQSNLRNFRGDKPELDKTDLWQMATMAQIFGEVSNLEENEEGNKFKEETKKNLSFSLAELQKTQDEIKRLTDILVIPSFLRSYANFKTEDLSETLITFLGHSNLFVRTTAANLLGNQKATDEIIKALQDAFAKSLETDREYNDAQLAILSALVKLDKTKANKELTTALNHYDFLLRRQAADLIEQNELQKDFPDFEKKIGPLKPYNRKNSSKLGQILNKSSDYRRAVSRKNGKVRAVLTTEKGAFSINLLPEDAPLTVDNFIKLAKSGYFNNVPIHRVVANFVVQDGDPVGNGSGGPGWQIRDEMNMVPYERGIVGMALSGPDTGGSQWFITHSPQPHLDGGYTVFGRVNEKDMKIVDKLVRGDRIISVKIVD